MVVKMIEGELFLATWAVDMCKVIDSAHLHQERWPSGLANPYFSIPRAMAVEVGNIDGRSVVIDVCRFGDNVKEKCGECVSFDLSFFYVRTWRLIGLPIFLNFQKTSDKNLTRLHTRPWFAWSRKNI